MKKSLLFGAALLSTVSAFAVVTDGDTYEPVNDIKCVNAWILDRNHNADAFVGSRIESKQSRTCVVKDGVVYISSWAADDPEVTAPDEKGNIVVQQAATVHKFNVEDGSYLGEIKVTLDGERRTGTGVINTIGVDNFGHIWVADMTFAGAEFFKVYTLDVETGACTLAASLPLGEEAPRIDYCDLVGDITLQEAPCTIMAAGSSSSVVFAFSCEKGSTEWYGNFEGSNKITITEFYPSAAGNWSTAPSVKILLGEDPETMYSGDLFYIDGASSAPTLYNTTGSIVESLEKAPAECAQKSLGANGVVEFTIDDRNFIAYPIEQYTGSMGGCNVNVCELGEGMTFEGMKLYWTVPTSGFGTTSDGGNRYHGLNREYVKDGNGNEYVNLISYKCFNGLALYKIGKYAPDAGVEGAIADGGATIAVNGNVVTVSAEAEEINVYNVAGQVVATAKNATEVAVPAQGAFIVKATVAGAPVVKKVVL